MDLSFSCRTCKHLLTLLITVSRSHKSYTWCFSWMENAENSSPTPLRNSAVFFKRCEHLTIACLGVAKVNYFVEFGADTRGLKKPAS